MESLSNYLLPHDSVEQTRLSIQHQHMKQVLDRENAVPEWFDMKAVSNVLDVAAGTLVWTFDLLSMPEVRDRSNGLSTDPINLYACDITDAKFPTKEKLESNRINTFLQDITRPFPIEFKEKFDLIHMSFLRFSLTEEGWKRTLENIYEILKPGGRLYLLETDNFFYTDNLPPPDKGSRRDEQANIAGTSWVHKLNTMYESTNQENGYISDLSYRFPSLLKAASFSVEAFERNLVPFGKSCETFKGLKGSSLADWTEFSIENLRLITETQVKFRFSKGILEAPLGHKIETEEECRGLITEILDGCKTEGTSLILSEYVARK